MMPGLAGSGELTAVRQECLAAAGPIRSGSDQPDMDWLVLLGASTGQPVTGSR